jgi:hypothetical protein
MVDGDLFSDLKSDLTWDMPTPSSSVGTGGDGRPETATAKARRRIHSSEENPDNDPPEAGEEVQPKEIEHKIDRLA